MAFLLDTALAFLQNNKKKKNVLAELNFLQCFHTSAFQHLDPRWRPEPRQQSLQTEILRLEEVRQPRTANVPTFYAAWVYQLIAFPLYEGCRRHSSAPLPPSSLPEPSGSGVTGSPQARHRQAAPRQRFNSIKTNGKKKNHINNLEGQTEEELVGKK